MLTTGMSRNNRKKLGKSVVHKILSMTRVKLIPIMEILEIVLEFSLTLSYNEDLDKLCRLIKVYVVNTSD